MSRRKLNHGWRGMSMRNWLYLGCASLLVAGSSLPVAASQWMAFQGVLQDSARENIGAGAQTNVTARFSLYADPNDTEPVWSEEQFVAIDDGRYSVFLGSGNPLLAPQPGLDDVLINGHRYLGIAIEIGGTMTEILPRQEIAAMPFALHSQRSRRLVNSQGEPLTQAEGTLVSVAGDARVIGDLQVASLQGEGRGLTDLSASNFSSGTVPVGLIPSLPASKITSGTFSGSSVPASAFSGSRFSIVRIPNLNASKFGAGTLGADRVPNLSAGNISGRVSRSRIPNLPASRFTSGTLPVNRGGTGSTSFLNDRIMVTDSAGRITTSTRLRYFTGSRTYLYAADLLGLAWTDWQASDWGGIATWDVVAAGVSSQQNSTRSDARLKTNVVSLAELDVAQRVFDLRPVTFEWIDHPDRQHFGFIAQEVQQLLPDLVDVGEDEMGTLSIRDDDMLALLVQAMQEQQKVIDAQQAEWQSLTAELDELEAELLEIFERVEQRTGQGGTP